MVDACLYSMASLCRGNSVVCPAVNMSRDAAMSRRTSRAALRHFLSRRDVTYMVLFLGKHSKAKRSKAVQRNEKPLADFMFLNFNIYFG